MLDEGYELEMYIIEGRIHVECYPRDLKESMIVGEKSPTIIILKYAFIPYKITIRFFAILRGVDVCNLH